MRSPCSLAVRMRAMTCGRLTRVSSSSSARSRASPSGGEGLGRDDRRRSAARPTAVEAARRLRRCAARVVPRDGVWARAVRHGRPRRRRRPPARRVSAGEAPPPVRGSARLSARSPCVRRSGAAGSPTGARRVRSGRAARSASGTPAANAARSASSYSSVAAVAAHQTFRPSSERSVLSQCPPAAGRRSPSSVLAIAATRRATDASRGADVQDGLRREPERAEARRQGLGRRHLAIEAQSLDPLDPLADTGQLDRSRRQRGRCFDHEDPRSLGLDRSPPDRWAIGHEADRTKEGRGAEVLGHRSMVQVTRSRYGSAVMSRRRHS